MGTIEEIIKMRGEGRSDEEIGSILRDRGMSEDEIAEVSSEAKIKEAVRGEETEDIKNSSSNPMQQTKEADMAKDSQYTGMQPSMLTSEQAQEQQEQQESVPYVPQSPEQYQQPAAQQDFYQPAQYDQYQYQPAGSGMSADTITEIAEQVVSEKLSSAKAQLEKVIDFKNTVESRMDAIDERLKRIERVMERLQLSVLQKVGDYMSNIDDIKKEVIETQKSFKALMPQKKTIVPSKE